MRRLFTPRWVLVHVSVVSLTAFMVFLGFWQLDRLEQRRERNAAIETNTRSEPVPATAAMGVKQNEWRRVRLSGTYINDKTVIVINRSQDGVAGDNIAVPFRTESNGIFLVNRGFVPLTVSSRTSPDQPLELVGYVRLTQDRRTLGAIDANVVGTKEFQRFDLPRIKTATGLDMNTGYFVQLIEESPSPGTGFPTPVPLPEVDEGSHFSYAMQWFFFSSVAFVAWIAVIRRRLREEEEPSNGSPARTSA